jgi:hypothetical protein
MELLPLKREADGHMLQQLVRSVAVFLSQPTDVQAGKASSAALSARPRADR